MRRWSSLLLAATLLCSSAAAARSRSQPQSQPRPRDGGNTAGSCRKLPPGKRIVRLNLKPDTNVADLVAWISSITCKQFIIPGNIPAASKTVTIISPQLMTPEEAYRLFLDALDSIGLTVYRTGPFLAVIEAAKAKTMPIPVIIPPPEPEPFPEAAAPPPGEISSPNRSE